MFTGNISGSTIGKWRYYDVNSSDKRLKDNIIQIGSPLEKINRIGGYEFVGMKTNMSILHDVELLPEIEEVITRW